MNLLDDAEVLGANRTLPKQSLLHNFPRPYISRLIPE